MSETTHYASDTNEEGKYIPKAYQFERDMDHSPTGHRFDSLIFHEPANSHLIYNGDDISRDLDSYVEQFLTIQKERLEVLDDYSKGNNYSILQGSRRLEKEKADYRARHNWGGYISNFITGYVMGKPVTIETDNEEVLESLYVINTYNDLDNLNYELAYDTSRYGRAFELIQRDSQGNDIVYLIDPREMFVIRSADVANEIIAGVHCPVFNGQVHVTLYTTSQIITYKPFEYQGKVKLTEQARKPHLYQDVPIVEWWNNRFRQGDFETEISLIDLYDGAQSDTANYMSDLNDALLVISGDLNASGLSHGDLRTMKEANYLVLESGIDSQGKQTQLDAKYIYKQYDVEGTESYKTRLMNDIYKLSQIPNLDDDRFYSGHSGVALRYKMIGLEQKRATKESFYAKALRRRYELIGNIHRELNDTTIDYNELSFTFHTNIPEDVWSEVERYISSGGEISQETLRALASFTDNQTETERLLRESLNPNATDDERAFMMRGLTNEQPTEV